MAGLSRSRQKALAKRTGTGRDGAQAHPLLYRVRALPLRLASSLVPLPSSLNAMPTSVITEEKVSVLRQLSNNNVPDNKLRRQLVKYGGDLNLAASSLFTDTSIAISSSIAVPQPSQQRAQRKNDADTHKKQPTPPIHQPQPQPQPQPQSQLQHQGEEQANIPTATPVEKPFNEKISPPTNGTSSKELRRRAWRHFYMERRAEAVQSVGLDKAAIDNYIAEAWRRLGSANRKKYMLEFEHCAPSEAINSGDVTSVATGNDSKDSYGAAVSFPPQRERAPECKAAARAGFVGQRTVKDGIHIESASPKPGKPIDGVTADESGNRHYQKENPSKSEELAVDQALFVDVAVGHETNDVLSKVTENTSKKTRSSALGIASDVGAVARESQPKEEGNAKEDDALVCEPQKAEPLAVAKIDPLKTEVSPVTKRSTSEDMSDVRRSKEGKYSTDFNPPAEAVSYEKSDVRANQRPSPEGEESDDSVRVSKPLRPKPQPSKAVEWPRLLVSRLCKGVMLTTTHSGLVAGDSVVLEAPKATKILTGRGRRRGGSSGLPTVNTKVVRFLKHGRELGRLASDVGVPLVPALQSGMVIADCKIVQPPVGKRMFDDVFLEITLRITKEAFDLGSNVRGVEGGYDVMQGDTENGECGIDTRRMSVVNCITSLKLCEEPATSDEDEPSAKVATGEDAGAVTEEDAESYYRTVAAIEEEEGKKFTPSRFLACKLREYQRIGVAWMASREKKGNLTRMGGSASAEFAINPLWRKKVFPDGGVFYVNPTIGGMTVGPPPGSTGGPYGGILADEMGLGKTVQCIACIVQDLEETRMSNGTLNTVSSKALMEDEKSGNEVEMKGVKSREGSDADDASQSLVKGGDVDMHTEDNGDEDLAGENNASDVEDDQVSVLRKRKSKAITSLQDDDGTNATPSRRSKRKAEPRRRKAVSPVDSERDGDVDENDGDEDFNPSEAASQEESRKREDADDSETEDCYSGADIELSSVPKRRRLFSHSNGTSTDVRSVLMSSANTLDTSRGGTLIVCPTSVLTQWMNEIKLHVKPGFVRSAAYYGAGRRDASAICAAAADVVVTTYGVLESEYNGDEGDENEGGLFGLKWRRVILDEAHCIRNRMTRSAKAAYHVQAERRWCVTGTVIHNHINDVFSLLHFLQLKPWSSWAFWKRGVVANLDSKNSASQKTAMSLVRDIISSVTIRRKKSTKDSNGQPIVQLTKKNVELVSLVPSAEERDFYDALYKRSKLKFDTFVAQGNVMKNFGSVFELLLRLRQACDHPYLVFAAAPSKDAELLKDRKKMYKQFVEGGASSEFAEGILKQAEDGTLAKERQCPVCMDVIEDAVAPKECGHPACRACLMTALERTGKCVVCRAGITKESVTTLPRDSRFCIDLDKRWQGSAKIEELVRELREREDARRKDGKAIGKSVVFSQFTGMLDLVEHALGREKFVSMRLDGGTAQAKRGRILEQFAREDEMEVGSANVLLVSVRAGGVGTTLVAANHAVLLDINWNPQIDLQAQDRVHRYGQSRDVTVRRYVIRETVEERMLQVQGRKEGIADGAMDRASDDDRKQASLAELKLLFG